jgi:RHS repeat-associated protein
LAANNFIAAKTVKELTLNKSFSYNLLNLPATSTFATGSATFAYDAAGSKLRKASTVSGTTTYTDYIAGIQHSGTTSESIEYIMTEEGQAVPNGTTSYNYEYFLGDNLGNTRRTFDISTGAARLVQSDDYYPFGWAVNSLVTGTQNYYLYNKKEQQPEFNENDYGARFYDPVIARWTSVDPLAEKFENLTSYTYAANNPIALSDPDGRNITVDLFGTVTYDNVGTPDALNAAYILQGKKKNIYVDIEGNKKTRKKENLLSANNSYNQWAVFASKNVEIASAALESIVKPGQLDNLVIESHGNMKGSAHDESGIDMVDDGTGNNFLWNEDLRKVNENRNFGSDCQNIESKVNSLKDLGALIKDNGNLIIAVCDVGKGSTGLDFGENVNYLTGCRLNTYLPQGDINSGIGVSITPGVGFVPFWKDTFNVNNSPGWLKISPQGNSSNIESIQMNIDKEGPPINIPPTIVKK